MLAKSANVFRCLAWVENILFVGNAEGAVCVWDMVKVQPIATLQDHPSEWQTTILFSLIGTVRLVT